MNLTKETIIQLLATNDRAIARALIVLSERQTADELTHRTSNNRNGRGFKQCHAFIGPEMAEKILKHQRITPAQANYWRQPDSRGNMRIAAYAGQLLEVAKIKQESQAA